MILPDTVFVEKKRVMISHLYDIPVRMVWSIGIVDLTKRYLKG